MAYLCLMFLFLIFGHVQNGQALQCWLCSTDNDVSCYDPFNTTKFLQMRSYYQQMNYNGQFQRPSMPMLKQCQVTSFGQVYDKKPMCIKRVTRLPYDKLAVSRDCIEVPVSQSAGACSDRSSNIEFCEYCEYDGCNAATGLRTNLILAAALPCALLFFLRR